MGESPENQALRIFEPDPDAVYSIEITERLTQIPRRTIAIYVKHRLVSPLLERGGGMFFDEEAIRMLRRIEQLHRFGFSVFAIDYRGFGKSEGDLPSEETVYADALAGWQWLAAEVPDATHRFIYGHSLGGAVAIDLAARLSDQDARAGGLIVESRDYADHLNFAAAAGRLDELAGAFARS